jgi:hypothetical protein
MSETQEIDNQEETPTITIEQFQELQNKLKAAEEEKTRILESKNQILTEKKKAQETARAAEEERAKKAGDYEQLYKSQQEKNAEWESKYTQLKSGIAESKRNNQAMKLASELAEGYNAELLSEQIAKRLKYTDEGLKVTDNNGQLTVSSIEDLKNEFKSSERYSALLRGNQSSGGGASGGNSGSATAEKTKSRADFGKMNPTKQMEFIKSGGGIFD